MHIPKILITKNINQIYLEILEKANMRYSVVPFIEIIKVKFSIDINMLKDKLLIFTSSNSVKYFFEDINILNFVKQNQIKIASLSGNTFKKINEYNLEPIITAAYSERLAEKILEQNYKQMVFICGKLKMETLPNMIKKAGREIEEIEVYDTKELNLKVDTNGYTDIVFFSPSGVRSFFYGNVINPETNFFAIGNTTKKEILKYANKNKIYIPHKTNIETLIKLIKNKYV